MEDTVALMLSGATTVKVTGLLAPLVAVTTIGTEPKDTPFGTVATILVLLQVAVAAIPPKVTVLEPCVAPKLEPLIVTDVPTGPLDGDKLVITGAGEGSISTALKLYGWFVGAVSFRVTLVPLLAIMPVTRCAHSVSAVPSRNWSIIVWFVPRVRAIAPDGSPPTPKTNEFPRVLVSVTEGAPDEAFAVPVAPMAPDPFVPLMSGPR